MRSTTTLKLPVKCKYGKERANGISTDRAVTYRIQATVIRRSKHRSAGYGFVTYETSDEAEKAAETLDKTELDGREISVQIARPKTSKKPTTTSPTKPRSLTSLTTASSTRIFVANLPYATTDDELAALFSDFTIESASIARLQK